MGESQILQFKPSNNATNSSNSSTNSSRMCMHVDCPGTCWVAIASLGSMEIYLSDSSINCPRTYLPSQLMKHQGSHIRQNIYQKAVSVRMHHITKKNGIQLIVNPVHLLQFNPVIVYYSLVIYVHWLHTEV